MEKSKYKPRCFFDVAIGNEPAGRIIFELFNDTCPKTCENFRKLCLGTCGTGLKTQKPLHYEGCVFHRVVKGFMIQGGDFSNGDGTGGESIYGGNFADEELTTHHDRPFLLSMANRGANTNGSQFFITTIAAPHLNGKHVVFGHVIKGQDVVKKMENVPVENHRPKHTVKIVNCGELVIASKKKVESSESSDDSDSQDSDEKAKRKKRAKKVKNKKKKKLNQQKEESDTENVVCDIIAIKAEDIPEVPPPNFLDRCPGKMKEEMLTSDRYESRQRGKYQEPFSKSGRKIKGRGALRYKTPSRSRSRSDTPPHWRQAERKTQKMSREEWLNWQTRKDDFYREKFRKPMPDKATSPIAHDSDDTKLRNLKIKKLESDNNSAAEPLVRQKRPKYDIASSDNEEGQINLTDTKSKMRIPVDYSDHSDDAEDDDLVVTLIKEKAKERNADSYYEENHREKVHSKIRMDESESDESPTRSPQYRKKYRQEEDVELIRNKSRNDYPPHYSNSRHAQERLGDTKRRSERANKVGDDYERRHLKGEKFDAGSDYESDLRRKIGNRRHDEDRDGSSEFIERFPDRRDTQRNRQYEKAEFDNGGKGVYKKRQIADRSRDDRSDSELRDRKERGRLLANYDGSSKERDASSIPAEISPHKVVKKKKKKDKKQSRRDVRSVHNKDAFEKRGSKSSSKSSPGSDSKQRQSRYLRRPDEELPLTERQPPPYLGDEDSQQELPPLPKLTNKSKDKLDVSGSPLSVPKIVQARHQDFRRINLTGLKNLQTSRDSNKKLAASPRTKKAFDDDSDSTEKPSMRKKKYLVDLSGEYSINLNLEPPTKSGTDDYLKKSSGNHTKTDRSPRSKDERSPRKMNKEVSAKSTSRNDKHSDRREQSKSPSPSQTKQRDWSYDDRAKFGRQSDDNVESKKKRRSRDSSEDSVKNRRTSRSRSWSYSSRDRGHRHTPPARLLARWQSRRKEAMRRVPWRNRRYYDDSPRKRRGHSRSVSSKSHSSSETHSTRRRRLGRSSRSPSVDKRYRNRSSTSLSPDKLKTRRLSSQSDASRSESPSYKKSNRPGKKCSRSPSVSRTPVRRKRDGSDSSSSSSEDASCKKRAAARDRSDSSGSRGSSSDEHEMKKSKTLDKKAFTSNDGKRKGTDDRECESDEIKLSERRATPNLVIKSQLTDNLLGHLDANVSSSTPSTTVKSPPVDTTTKKDTPEPAKPVWQEEVVSSGPSILAALTGKSSGDGQPDDNSIVQHKRQQEPPTVVVASSRDSELSSSIQPPVTTSLDESYSSTTNPELISKRGWSIQKKSPIRLVPLTPPKPRTSKSRSRKRSPSYSRSRSSRSSHSRSSSSRRHYRHGRKRTSRYRSPSRSSSYSSRSASYRGSRSRYKRPKYSKSRDSSRSSRSSRS